MALLIHNFSKLPPPFPAMHGLTVQGSSILRDFSPAAFPWAARSPPLSCSPARTQPSCWPSGTKRAFSLPRPISAGTVLLLQLPG